MLLESKLLKKRKQTEQEYKMWLIKEMFNFIGAEYSDEFVSQEDWYWKCSWTQDEENEYKKWMVNDLRDLGVTKKIAIGIADWFLMDYGWKIKC